MMINEKCNMRMETDNRTSKYSKNVWFLYPLLREEPISPRVKTPLYKTILRPVLTYGCECWVVTTRLKSRVQAAMMNVLRLIKG